MNKYNNGSNNLCTILYNNYRVNVNFLQHFACGTKVLMKNMKHSYRMGEKLDTKWSGPYIIDKKLSKGCYRLRSQTGFVLKKLYSSILLKEYIEPG